MSGASGTNFTRHIVFVPGYCKRPEKPGDPDYGIDAMKMIFVLEGPKGAVNFSMDIGLLPEAALKDLAGNRKAAVFQAEMLSRDTGVPQSQCLSIIVHQRYKNLEHHQMGMGQDTKFQPADLGQHHRVHRCSESESDEEIGCCCAHNDSCEFLDGAECWYSGSGLAAGPVFKRFCEKGEDGVWEELEKHYARCFDEEGN